jgi:hypothetical protein
MDDTSVHSTKNKHMVLKLSSVKQWGKQIKLQEMRLELLTVQSKRMGNL